MTDRIEKKEFKKVEWVPVKNISVVWAQSQRPLNEKHAQNIADNFDPDMFGVIAVTKPNGHGVYHAIDGHHRKVAVEKLWGKNEMVPCQVYDAEDPAKAARLFDHLNSARRNLQPVEMFRVRVTAGNKVEVGVDEIVRGCGLVVGHKAKNSIHCVQALISVYQSYGPVVLKASLKIIGDIWGYDSSAFVANLIRGFGEFLSEFRHVDPERLKQSVAKKYTPARLLGSATAAREYSGGSMATCVKEILMTTYNQGLKTKKLVGKKDK